MGETVQVRVTGSKGVKVVTLEKGVVNKIQAQASQKMELFDVTTGQAPKKIRAQRAGNDYILKVVDEVGVEEIDLVIEDFHSSNASLWGGSDTGLMQQYEVAETTQMSEIALDGVNQVANTGASFVGAPWMMAIGALAIAAGAGGNAKSGRAAPPAPGINTIAGDNTINAAEAVNAVVITGTKDAGASVNLKLGGINTHTIAANADTTWSYTLTAADIAALGQGDIELSSAQTDAAGNVSVASTRTITLDTTFPANMGLRLVADNGSSNADDITNVAVVNVLDLEAGATWEYQVDGGAWIAGSGTSFDLANGIHNYAVRQTDLAGNTGANSPVETYTLDTTPVVAERQRAQVQLEAISQTRGSDQRPQVTALGVDGAYVVTWYGQDSEGDNSIFVQRFHASGTLNGHVVQLEAVGKTNGDDSVPQAMAVGTTGAFVITWQGMDAAGDSSIFVQLFNADGSLGGNATQLEAVGKTNGIDEGPKVAAVGTMGAYAVVWQGQDSSTNADQSIFVQLFNANGTTNGATVQLEAVGAPNGVDWFAQITAVGTSGSYVVVWQGQESNSSEYSIFVQHFGANGIPNGVAVKLEAIGRTDGNDWEPRAVAVGDDGDYVVTWYAQDAVGSYSVYVQSFNADGSLNGMVTQLETMGVTNGVNFYPQIATLGNEGAFVVTWQGVDAQGDGSIFVQQFNADGTTIGRQTVVLEPQDLSSGQDRYPQISALGAGGAYVVTWYGQDGESDDSIFVQRFEADGSLNGALIQLEADGVANRVDQYPQIAAVGDAGAFVVTWQGVDAEGDNSIFVQHFNADGSRIQDAIALQLAAGQDKWLTQSESMATLEVRYLELTEGDVIQLLDAGTAVRAAYTVTAAEVSAGYVSLMIQKTNLADLSPGSKEGAHRITAVVTDLAGNVSDETAVGITLTVDTRAQAPELSLSVDTGGVDSITKVAKVNVLGLESRASWQYQVDGGAWVNGSGSSFNLTHGTHSYSVRQTDAAGNASNPSAARSYTLDTTPPSAPTFNAITADNVINAMEISGILVISGSKEVGAFVTLTIGSNAYALVADNTTTWSYTLTATDIAALSQGVQTLTATQTDAAGNASVASSHTFTVDTVVNAPALALASDSGGSNTDGVTNVATVNVTGLEVGSTWEYRVDSGGWSTGSGASFNLTHGTHSYNVRQTDAAGNVSNLGGRTFNLDTTAVDTSVVTRTMVQLEPTGKTNGMDDRSQIAAVGTSGAYAVTWTGPNNLNQNCIFVQQFNADGTTTGYPIIQILAPININTPNPQITAVNASGAYVVTWHSADSSGDNSIFVQRFDANGTPNGTLTKLEAIGKLDGNDQYSCIAALRDGAYVVTWQGIDTAGDTSIFVQQFNADGSIVGRPAVQLEAVSNISGHDVSPEITSVGISGAYVVTWYGDDSNGGDQSVFVQLFNADGTINGPTAQLESPGVINRDDAYPKTTAAGSGGAYVTTWWGFDDQGYSTIFFQRFNANGTTNGSIGQLKAIGVVAGYNIDDAIASVGATGGYVIAWTGADSQGDRSVFVQQFNADGSTAGFNAVQLEAIGVPAGSDWGPQITSVGTNGAYVVVWGGDDSEGGDFSIFVQRFNADGTITGHEMVQLEAMGNSAGYDGQPRVVAVGTEGAFVVTWPGEDAQGDQSIFVQQFNADGTLVQKKVTMLVAAGQDQWLNASENSVTIELRYAELAEGDVIKLLDSTTIVGVPRRVTASEANAGFVSIIVQKAELASGGGDGIHNLKAVITDLAGNVSNETPVGIKLKIDSLAPSAPTINLVSGNDYVNANEASGFVVVSGFKEAGAFVTLSLGGRSYISPSDFSTAWRYTLTAADIAALSQGVQTLTATQTDAAGNASVASSHTFTVDTVVNAPALALASDSGGSNTDGVTNVATVNVTGLEVGSTWEYRVDSGGWSTGSGASFNLTNGTHGYSVRQTDAAGNTSSASTARTYTLDNTAVVSSAPRNSVQLEATGKTNGADQFPQITALSSGGYVVTWTGQDSAGDESVFIQQFNAEGTMSGAQVQLDAIGNTNGVDKLSEITAIGTNGAYVVTWTGQDSAVDYSIFVQQFNPNGTSAGYPPVQLEAIGKSNGADRTPQITALSSGGYVVTWSGQDSSAGDDSIFVQQFNANGTTTGYTPVQLEAIGKTNGADQAPQITAIGTNGTYVVTWMGLDSAGDYSIFVQKFNANGTINGAAYQLEAIGNTTGFDSTPELVSLGADGSFVVVWYGVESDLDESVFVQQFNADGTQNALVKLEAPGKTNGFDQSPQVVKIGATGEYIVSWFGENSTGGYSTFFQKFNADGTTSGYTPVQMDLLANNYFPAPEMQITAVGNDGAFAATWVNEEASGDLSIFVQLFHPDGTTTGNAMVKLEALGVLNAADFRAQIAAVGSDGAYAVTWQGIDSSSPGDSSIFVQHFNADGTARENKIMMQVAAGQNKQLDVSESSITLEVRYGELALGDVILLKEMGAAIDGAVHTVTAADVSAGFASVVVQKSAFAVNDGEREHRLTAVVTDLAGNVSQESPVGITLTVDALLPVFSSATAVNVLENTSAVVYDANATDNGARVDAGVAYTMGGVDAGLFDINAINGQVTFKLSPDFENPLDFGSNNIYDFTVTATDVVGNAVTQGVALTVNNVFAGDTVIDLGAGKGQLLHGIQVEGKWYYVWDADDDGAIRVGTITTPPAGDDRVSMDYLAATFLGGGATGADITTSNRSFSVNGVQLLLPEAGVVIPSTGEVAMNGTTWSNATPGWNTNPNANPTYNDMLAVWDAYNGTGTGANVNGSPPNWNTTTGGYYWTADALNANHGYVGAFGGVGFDANVNFNFVMFQVL